MITVAEVMSLLDELAPPALAEGWDRIGLQVGDPAWPTVRVLVSLGFSRAVLEEAERRGCGMVVSHHPLIFRPLTALRLDDPIGFLVGFALERRIAVGVAHTNLDRVSGGLNDWLAEVLRLRDVVNLAEAAGLDASADGVASMGRVGTLEEPVTLGSFAREIGRRLGVGNLRYVGDPDSVVHRVACVGGAGADAIESASRAGVHCLVTGDVKFHEALEALERGLTLVDPGHFGSEALMRHRLARGLMQGAARRGWSLEALASEVEQDPFSFLRIEEGRA